MQQAELFVTKPEKTYGETHREQMHGKQHRGIERSTAEITGSEAVRVD